ncbi:autorepressor SdpR family transcription factor [Chitinophaga defluvii]|uniref:Autorepressor SdpR family transcription factor n=1 Tax=Chitinophaga defluvii TaxID=3163343 RepID=A0ABV2T0W3_9BACT
MNTVFKALNDQTRRDILELLKKEDMTAGQIADHFNFSKPTISHHLDLLKQAELLTSVKKGQFIYYSLNITVMDELLKWMLQFTDALPLKKKPVIKYERK